MAEYADRIERTLKAAADLSGGPTHRLVSITGVSQVGSGADGGIAVGVLENKPAAANRAARVTVFGVTKVRAGAARSEERRVGKEWRSRWSPDHQNKHHS